MFQRNPATTIVLIAFAFAQAARADAATIVVNSFGSALFNDSLANTPTYFGNVYNVGAAASFNPSTGTRNVRSISRNLFWFGPQFWAGQTVLSATLQILMPDSGYASVRADETYQVFDVNATYPFPSAGGGFLQLNPISGGPGCTGSPFAPTSCLDIFDDLGSGTLLGQAVVSAADEGKLVSIDLNSEAIASLNAATGQSAWNVGGSLLDEPAIGDTILNTRFFFTQSSWSASNARLLLEVVPEPSASILCGFGVCAFFVRWRASVQEPGKVVRP